MGGGNHHIALFCCKQDEKPFPAHPKQEQTPPQMMPGMEKTSEVYKEQFTLLKVWNEFQEARARSLKAPPNTPPHASHQRFLCLKVALTFLTQCNYLPVSSQKYAPQRCTQKGAFLAQIKSRPNQFQKVRGASPGSSQFLQPPFLACGCAVDPSRVPRQPGPPSGYLLLHLETKLLMGRSLERGKHPCLPSPSGTSASPGLWLCPFP